jgi:regulator of protease activity HflC (stomatin/prohibitin superfamily)
MFAKTLFVLAAIWWGLWIALAYGTGKKTVGTFLLVIGIIWAASSWILVESSAFFALLLVPIVLLPSMVRIITEYERGVLFRFGKLTGSVGPGLNVLLPFGIDQLQRIDLRTLTIDVPKQEVITKDNVPVMVDAVVYFNVADPILAVTRVMDYIHSTTLLGQTFLRSVLGQHELDDMLAKRAELNSTLRNLLDEATDPWGIKVTAVEIKAVELPDTMKRAMAKQAEAERERRAKIIAAEGEFEASQKLLEAAQIIAAEPAAMQLRYLQALSEISTEGSSTTIFPLPIEILRAIDRIGKD